MLAYAFQVLNEQGYKSIETEQFDNVAEMCAAILSKGVSLQLKRGLGRDYIQNKEPLSSLRGKIEISESIKEQSIIKRQLICSYDELSVNSYMNRIIKATMALLLRSDISKSREKELRKLLVFFDDVELMDIHEINWHIQYNRNNQTYRILIAICYLVIKGLLQTTSDGTTRMMDFLDEQRMCHLYEKFILEYYRKEYPKLSVSASQISWALDDEKNDMLPVMQTDIMLSHKNKILIIDAKYYSHSTQEQYDIRTIHSGNLYQIFTYVKNKEAIMKDEDHEVAGMLLYAQTDEAVQPNNTYHMSGNSISVKSLDLNCEFSTITKQLNTIANDYFGDILQS
jgi:5-methylcytosine-specific restriction enzyme subunit McrC